MAVLDPTNGYRAKGFTLIEVVVVLLLLGILSSIAIPRFLDLRQDALLGTLKGIEGALHSTTGIYQPLAAVKGVKTGSLLINGANVQFHSGFPDGHWNNAFRYILDISADSGYTGANARCTDYRLCGVGMRAAIPTVAGTTGGRGVIIWPEGYRISQRCFVYYYNRHDGSYPLIGRVDSGC
ncbi:MAG: prepilin-type N-terminal cleavage/methylation domain-containing protein [Granulosicoccus sp.]|nr:prepilin-type N-terminal cleavage/methylation domain-containing protein [Granulosicoccus sp.]